MKIVFWSPVHGQTRQSSNMLAVALMLAMKKKYRVMITQTQFRMNDLEDAVVGRAVAIGVREQFFQNMGIDAVCRCIKHKQLEKTDLENCCIQVLPESDLMLLPGTQSGSYEIHYELLGEMLPYLLGKAEKYFDYVLVDVNPGKDGISRQLVGEAEAVVVNLSQSVGVLDTFFLNYPKELTGKKVFYLFGSYLADSSYNLNNLRFRYGQLKRENSGVIPLNVGFMDAVSGGKVVDYFEANLDSEAGDANYRFISEVDKVSERLLGFMGMKNRQVTEKGSFSKE